MEQQQPRAEDNYSSNVPPTNQQYQQDKTDSYTDVEGDGEDMITKDEPTSAGNSNSIYGQKTPNSESPATGNDGEDLEDDLDEEDDLEEEDFEDLDEEDAEDDATTTGDDPDKMNQSTPRM